MKYLKSENLFTVLLAVLLLLSVLCSCEKSESLSIEGKINKIEPAEDGVSSWITIEDRKFLFTRKTYYVDSWKGYLSGRENAVIDKNLVGRYCLAGWGKDGENLLLLDVSGWQQPVFTMR